MTKQYARKKIENAVKDAVKTKGTRTIVYPGKGWDVARCEKEFTDNMKEDLKGSIYKPEEIDLFIFPIYQAEHFYIICVNIKGGRVDVVDNSPSMQNVPMRFKYGTVAPMLLCVEELVIDQSEIQVEGGGNVVTGDSNEVNE
ncbi:hypothetical protein CASFOL_036610 [Castilleja foliolosa]|uniref:Ubiquitin-like protease family profile domain-containing protein n=1 Tax=Castilleja foliolosa TaxID=1961234 RepID=A0ABD3BQS1_9LAMI